MREFWDASRIHASPTTVPCQKARSPDKSISPWPPQRGPMHEQQVPASPPGASRPGSRRRGRPGWSYGFCPLGAIPAGAILICARGRSGARVGRTAKLGYSSVSTACLSGERILLGDIVAKEASSVAYKESIEFKVVFDGTQSVPSKTNRGIILLFKTGLSRSTGLHPPRMRASLVSHFNVSDSPSPSLPAGRHL
jgi:hypothetical protein